MALPHILAALAFASAALADVRNCECDPVRPETLGERNCGLCREAENQAAGSGIFFLKDINPRKPGRWLALPKWHMRAGDSLAAMTPVQRTELWTSAIEKAKLLWGDQWGLAWNGDSSRTQCHAHIHIGKLLDGMETGRFIVVSGPAEIPVPEDGGGLWVHPGGGRLHAHTGEEITETVLMR